MVIVTDELDGVKMDTPQAPRVPSRPDHFVLDFVNEARGNVSNGEDLPPEFTPYQADFCVAKNGWIISHDSHLNEDGITFEVVPTAIGLTHDLYR